VCEGAMLDCAGYVRTHANASEFERMPMSAVERKRYVRTHSAKQKYIYIFWLFFYFLFFTKIITQKLFTYTKQNTYRYLHTKMFTNTKQNNCKYLHTKTSTPPPNLKHHIAHNVTECTKPRGRVNSGIA
jgi:hypothetical protein